MITLTSDNIKRLSLYFIVVVPTMSKNEIQVPLAPLVPEADRVASFDAFPNSSRVVDAQVENFNNQ